MLQTEKETKSEIETVSDRERECVLPDARNADRHCLAVTYRGGVECGSGKEAELPVLGDTGSHCHTVTVGTTHSVVVVDG